MGGGHQEPPLLTEAVPPEALEGASDGDCSVLSPDDEVLPEEPLEDWVAEVVAEVLVCPE
jgi:hypothetical protein